MANYCLSAAAGLQDTVTCFVLLEPTLCAGCAFVGILKFCLLKHFAYCDFMEVVFMEMHFRLLLDFVVSVLTSLTLIYKACCKDRIVPVHAMDKYRGIDI